MKRKRIILITLCCFALLGAFYFLHNDKKSVGESFSFTSLKKFFGESSSELSAGQAKDQSKDKKRNPARKMKAEKVSESSQLVAPESRKLKMQKAHSYLKGKQRGGKDTTDEVQADEEILIQLGKKYKLDKKHYAVDSAEMDEIDMEAESQNGHYILTLKAGEDLPENALEILKDGSGNKVIFTRVLSVKFQKNKSLPQELMGMIHESLKTNDNMMPIDLLEKREEHIRLYYYQFADFEQTMKAYHALQSKPFDEMVERVQIELLSRSMRVE